MKEGVCHTQCKRVFVCGFLWVLCSDVSSSNYTYTLIAHAQKDVFHGYISLYCKKYGFYFSRTYTHARALTLRLPVGKGEPHKNLKRGCSGLSVGSSVGGRGLGPTMLRWCAQVRPLCAPLGGSPSGRPPQSLRSPGFAGYPYKGPLSALG